MTPEQEKALALARARKRRAEAGSLPQETKDRLAAAKAGTLMVSPENAGRQAYIDAMTEQRLNDTWLTAFGSGMGKGASFGFADEIAAGIGSAGENEYSDILGRLRDRDAALKEDRPVASALGEVVGAIGSTMATRAGIPLAAGASLPAKMVAGGLTGAAEGALYGFGTGEGGAGNRAKNAAFMGAVGGAAGVAAPPILGAIGAAGRTAGNAIGSALNIPSDLRASRVIETLMRRAGMTADDLDAVIKQAQDEGQPYNVADALGQSGQRALSGVTRQPGEARQVVTDALRSRQDDQANRIGSFLADALDAPDTGAARKAALTTARREAADAAYETARMTAGPVDVRGVLAVIDDRIGPMQGSGIADDGISGKLSRYRGRLAAKDPANSVIRGETGVSAGGGEKTAVELSDFNRILLLKQEVGDDIGAAVRAGRNNEARELKKVQDALDAALEAASPGYRSANDDFAKASRVIGKIDEGAAAAGPRIRAADTGAKIAAMTPDEKAAFSAGYADPIMAKIEAAAPGVNKARGLMSEKAQAELGWMAKDPELLRRRLERENRMFETNALAMGGSRTADNLADIADMQGLSSSVVGNVLSGRWGAAGGQILDRLLAGASGTNPKTREIIAQMLLSNNSVNALAPAVARTEAYAPIVALIENALRAGSMRAAD